MEVIRPHPGRQELAFRKSEYEVLFGGLAGPGKTWWLVIDALGLRYKATKLKKAAIEIPEYRGILFRRTTTQLGKMIDEAKKHYTRHPYFAKFTTHRIGDPGPAFTFPSGAKIYCCHLQREADKENHDGQEYQYEGWDELTHFTFTQYMYLFLRARSKIPGLTVRVRSTSNPRGTGLIWVRKRFVENLEPMKTHYFLPPKTDRKRDDYRGIEVENPSTLTESEKKEILTRCYIPGIRAENVTLFTEDPGYEARIKALGSVMWSAMGLGDWWAFSGDFFPFNIQTMVIQPFAIPKTWKLFGGLDPGWSSPCSFSLRAVDPEGNHYRLGTYYESGRSPIQNAAGIKEFIETFPFTQDEENRNKKPGYRGRYPSIIATGHDAWAHKDRFAIQANDVTFEQVFQSMGITLMQAVTDRKNGWGAMKDLMIGDVDNNGIPKGIPKYFVFDIFNEPFIDEITAAVSDERDENDIKGKGNDPEVSDHALDDDRYCTMSSFKPRQRNEEQEQRRQPVYRKRKRELSDF